MKIVIEIPERLWTKQLTADDYVEIVNAVANGTPLPKGHGKLVDVNSIPKEDRDITVKSLLHPGTIAVASVITLEEYVNSLPVIIEADKEE